MAVVLITVVMISFSFFLLLNVASTKIIPSVVEDELEAHTCEYLLSQTSLLSSAIEDNMNHDLAHFKTISISNNYDTSLNSADDTGALNDGHFYPSPLTDDWNNTMESFYDIYENTNDNIDMLRVFHKNGYVVAGVALGEEDLNYSEYKGDKSWFQTVMDPEQVPSGEFYVSEINIARVTNTTAIRYATPIDYQGERLGLLSVNFKANTITDIIQNFKFMDSGYSMLVDTNYSNAEGVLSEWPVIVSRTTNETTYQIYTGQDASPDYLRELGLNNSSDIEFTEQGVDWVGHYVKVNISERDLYVIINTPKDEIVNLSPGFYEDVKSLKMNGYIVMGAGIVCLIILSSILSMYLSKKISKPIVILTESVHDFQKNDENMKV